ncbi:hypothetical protein GCM10009836_03990 [Pseudonocardia ailaonensis]|uniref:Uncharacterized protein n=1 Tax=Pseudonocardia ailaonensis TaxID=367279 RepID=A0ABN2MK31_9PSEU
MTTIDDRTAPIAPTKEQRRDQPGPPRVRIVAWDTTELQEPCQSYGKWKHSDEPAVALAEDVRPDPAALRAAARTVALLVDVLAQRRPPRQLTELVEPMVLRYLAAVRPQRPGTTVVLDCCPCCCRRRLKLNRCRRAKTDHLR